MSRSRRIAPPAATVVVLLSSLLLADAAWADNAFQVTDLWEGDAPALIPFPSTQGTLVVDGHFLFAGSHPATGVELWRSDGTREGTTLILDIHPGLSSSTPANLTGHGRFVYFTADDGDHGSELWRTDGTAAGTTLVRDVCPGECNGTPANSPLPGVLVEAAAGDHVFFAAYDETHGTELWRSDGTAGGTQMVVDLWPGAESSWPTQLSAVGSELYFVATADEPARLWRTDGTPAGTSRVNDVGSAQQSWGHGPTSLTPFGGRLFFVAEEPDGSAELWRTDGTASGTVRLTDACAGVCTGVSGFAGPGPLLVWNDRLYFAGWRPETGTELWSSDGTPDGTAMVADWNPGDAGGIVAAAPHVDSLFLVVDDGIHGPELWVGDGTLAGCHMIHDFYPGRVGAGGSSFVSAGGLMYFVSYGGLWRSDGTLRGTRLIYAPYTPPGSPGWPTYPIADFGGRLLFLSGSGEQYGYFLTSGERGETQALAITEATIPGGDLPGSFPRTLTPVADGLAFVTSGAYSNLWYTQGSAGTTVALAPDHSEHSPGQLAAIADSVYYASGPMVWRAPVSGEPPSIAFNGAAEYMRVEEVAAAGSRLFFVAGPLEGRELMVLDADGAGAAVVKDICQGDCLSAMPSSLTAYGERLAFAASPANFGPGLLWVTDGTEAGTVELARLEDSGYYPLHDFRVTASGPLLFFAAETPGNGRELWVSDGRPDSALILRDICPGACSGVSWVEPNRHSGQWAIAPAAESRVYFLADDGEHGLELWVSDGTAASTRMVADLTQGPASSDITWMTGAGSQLFFAFDDGEHGRELWHSDGTPEGTRLVEDIFRGPSSGDPQHLAWGGGALVFAATDGVHGLEPWLSSGVWWGTRPIADIVPGPGSSSPQEFTWSGGMVYFRAYELVSGFELWAAAIEDEPRVRRRVRSR